MNQGPDKSCEGCGAAVTGEQIVQRKAGLVGGKLLCPNCVEQKRRELLNARSVAPAQTSTASQLHATPAAATIAPEDRVYVPPIAQGETVDSIALVAEDEMPMSGGSGQIHSFAESSTLAGGHKDFGFVRPLAPHNAPATRCRTFHGKLTAAGLAHMDEQINEWIDAHPEVFVKSSNSTVGVFEGKSKEPHLLVTVFY